MCNRHESDHEHDELRARFTTYIQHVINYSKSDYLKKLRSQQRELSIMNLNEEPSVDFDAVYCENAGKSDFEFEEERLAVAFSSLPLMRKRILQLSFIEDMSPPEIAERLNCSVKYIYDQQYLALRKLRNMLGGYHEKK